MTPASGPAARCPGRRVGSPSYRLAEDLIAALLEVASVARWPVGPLVLDVDAATLCELLAPLLDGELASELAGTDDPAGARAVDPAPAAHPTDSDPGCPPRTRLRLRRLADRSRARGALALRPAAARRAPNGRPRPAPGAAGHRGRRRLPGCTCHHRAAAGQSTP